MIPDPELLRLYLENSSQAAFTELVERHVGLVYHAALRQVGGDAHAARDVAQTVFSDLARKAAKLQRRPTVASWLHTSTRFAASKLRRANHTRAKYEQEAIAMHIPDRVAISWEKLRPLIDEVIEELEEPERQAVLLRFFLGHSHAEIGAVLNISADAARMRVSRALDRLNELLSRRHITSSGAALGLILGEQAAGAVPAGLGASLANAAVSTSTASAGLGALITASNLVTLAAGLTLFMSLGVTIYQRSVAQSFEPVRLARQAERDQLVARRHELQNSLQRMEDQINSSLAAKLPGVPGATSAAAAPQAAWDEEAEGNAFMVRHPEARQALDAYAAARVRFQFGSLLDSSPLPVETREKLEALLAKGIGMGALVPVLTAKLRSLPVKRAPSRRTLVCCAWRANGAGKREHVTGSPA